jgi:TonB family protein
VNTYTTFPKEFTRDWFAEVDKRFLVILLITLVVHVSLVVYLQGYEWAQMTEEDVGRYLDAIYRVKPATLEREARLARTVATGAGEAVEEVVEEAPVEEAAPRAAKRRGSRAQLAQAKRSMQESARSIGIFRLAGAQTGAKSTGGSGVARGLKDGGGLGGVEVGKIAGIATGSAADKVDKARGGGRITEGAGAIDITQLSDAEIDELLAASTVEIAALPEVEGLASKNVNRSGASIRSIADANVHLVKNCYNKYKRKDVNLKGKVRVEWTILPDGSVTNVRMLSSEWTKPNLGRRVESCLKDVISTWLFDPIPPESGVVRARQTYIFD